MKHLNSVTLDNIIKKLKLEVIHRATDASDIKIYTTEVNRPGLPIVGYFEKFVPERIQIIGNAEWLYYNELPYTLRYDSIDKFLAYPIPALIVARDLPIFPELLELAKKHNRTLLRAKKNTSIVINELVSFLSINLAPTITMHGVLIEVYGIGVLITGKSGIGKSETALDLIIRGHRLVADDSVEIRKDEDKLFGQYPELIRYFMEIRGIGIIDVERLYGVGAVKEYEYIDLVVELEFWDDNKAYDRLGLDEETTEILGVKVPRVIVPVKPGRNLAMIVELAARNNRQKRLGYNAAQVLNERIMKEIEDRKKENGRSS